MTYMLKINSTIIYKKGDLMKLFFIFIFSLIIIGCSNQNKKEHTTTIVAGTIEDGKFKEQYRQENIEKGETYFYINN